MRIIGNENKAADHPAREIKNEITRGTQRPLDVVPEYPKKDHVAKKMADIGMEELIGDEGGQWRQRPPRADVSPQRGRREAEGIDHAVEPGLRRSGLIEEYRQIGRDQAPGDNRLHRLGER